MSLIAAHLLILLAGTAPSREVVTVAPCSFRPGGRLARSAELPQRRFFVENLELDGAWELECDPGVLRAFQPGASRASTLTFRYLPEAQRLTLSLESVPDLTRLAETAEGAAGLRELEQLATLLHKVRGDEPGVAAFRAALFEAKLALLRRTAQWDRLHTELSVCRTPACAEQLRTLDAQLNPGIVVGGWKRIGKLPWNDTAETPFEGCSVRVFWRRDTLCVAQNASGSQVRCYAPASAKWGPPEPRGVVRGIERVGGSSLGLCGTKVEASADVEHTVLAIANDGLLVHAKGGALTWVTAAGASAVAPSALASVLPGTSASRVLPPDVGLGAASAWRLAGARNELNLEVPRHSTEGASSGLLASPSATWLAVLTREKAPVYDTSRMGDGRLLERGSEWELWLAPVTYRPREAP